MLEAEAKRIAIDFVTSQQSTYYSLHFKSINTSTVNSNNWAVAFEVRPSSGGILEGPVFVMVNDATKAVQFLDLQ